MTEVHSDGCDKAFRARASLLTGPSRGVRCGEEGVLAGIAELVSQALEGVPARSVELHGLCLVLGVSLAAPGGILPHKVSVAVVVPAVVPPLLGGVAVGEVLYNRGDDDGVESFRDLVVTWVTVWVDEVHSTKDTVGHCILRVQGVGIVD